ncbi:Translation initiation factor 2 subunit alpha [uncultured archaeon]|nr:Translation initiation factor 2 subunit alpha [uncultured archaeon]
MEELEVGDLILCTVDRIVGTVIFVRLTWEGKEIEGSIALSEIAPGRIRNLRDYVVPKKKIVCKVLRIKSGNVELSLRRVSQKEKKEVLEKESQGKSYVSVLKGILGEKAEEVMKEISKTEDLVSFLEESKTNSSKLEKIAGKENSKKIVDILNSHKKKILLVKKEINLTTTQPNGITLIKKVLETFKGIKVKYISAGRYSLEIESEDAKTADKKLRDLTVIAEKEAKKSGIEFAVK